MENARPTVFIGSSAEGLSVAEAIQQNLDRVAECVPWSQGVFGLMGGTLETLVAQVETFDFAILVLTDDDLVSVRGTTEPCARDNVLFEFGLFVGAIGRERTFGVFDRTSKLRIPSDLAGVTLASFQPHSSGNAQASLGATCTEIKAIIDSLGPRPRIDPNSFLPLNERFQIITDLLDTSDFQFLIALKELDLGIERDRRTKYNYTTGTHAGNGTAFSYSNLCEKLPDAGLLRQDLRNNVSLTNRGREYVSWLLEHGYRSETFTSDFASWPDPKIAK